MALEAWLTDADGDQRLPHHRNPKELVSLSDLEEIGILYWHVDPKDHENNEELKKIRENRGYSYTILSLSLSPPSPGPHSPNNFSTWISLFQFSFIFMNVRW